MSLAVEIVPATFGDKVVLRHLIELYAYDFSEFTAEDVDEHGSFGYRYFDHYWTEPDRHPFLFRVDGRIAGFAFVRSGGPHDMAEFFVLRKYRGRRVGLRTARSLFAKFPGDWQVRQLAANAPATAFWRLAIPVPFREEADDRGCVQFFHIAASDGM
jgi:predicted acetyltransferase